MRRPLATIGLLTMLPLCGCYEQTVSSRGLGGVGRTTQSSYRSNTALDRGYDSIFGTEQKPAKGADNMPITRKTQWAPTVGN